MHLPKNIEQSGYNNQYKTLAPNIKKQQSTLKSNSAFTIVELLVVIVVIGVLAAITAVSYAGISQKANVAAIQQQLSNNSSLLKLYNAENASYPTSLDSNYCPSAPVADTKNCLKNLDGATMTYSGSVSTFSLTISKSGANYKITDAGSIAKVITCPTGYIVVPGSPTYGTSDFCVMKYEAKYDSATGKAVSVPEGQPWTSISQTSATTAATAACSNCHLITEAEWMTIAQNVLSVPSNWSTGTVGSGFIYSGHNDNSAGSLVASSNDSDGYIGTGNTTGSNQRRTLTLTNGEVIWDLAGNVWEWTSGQAAGGQPGVGNEAGYTWKEYTTVMVNGSLAVNPLPSGTGISWISTLNGATNGIGRLNSYPNDTSLRGFVRGGSWNDVANDGVLTVAMCFLPLDYNAGIGFRVSSSAS